LYTASGKFYNFFLIIKTLGFLDLRNRYENYPGTGYSMIEDSEKTRMRIQMAGPVGSNANYSTLKFTLLYRCKIHFSRSISAIRRQIMLYCFVVPPLF
jgi:hypothetical protein